MIVGSFEIDGVLDGGLVINIASLDLVRRLGVTHLYPNNHEYVFANGSKSASLGQVHDLPVTIAGKTLPVNAVVFDHQHYPLLLGRRALKEFKIGTDWDHATWYIKINSQAQHLLVEYHSSY